MIKEVREFYGIPQHLLAGYLGVTRSQLSMAEIGKRSLPPAATLALLKLHNAMKAKGSSKGVSAVAGLAGIQQNKRNKLAVVQFAQREADLLLLQHSLSLLVTKQQQAINIMQCVTILKEQATPKEILFIELVEHSARQTYNRSGEDTRLALELSIQALQAEMAFLRKQIKK